MKYRLALDLGSTSLGWAIVLLKKAPDDGQLIPCAIVRTGVRIFQDGRNQKDGSSLAVTRRNARAMRRRRDRLLKRKLRVMQALIDLGFFPGDTAARKALERLNPYELRAKGLDHELTPAEFARAVFHLNQRRGFQSNRKTDKKESDSSALTNAIGMLREALDPAGTDGKPRTVGEFLWNRIKPEKEQGPLRPGLVRARYRQVSIPMQRDDGSTRTRIDKSYDLYMDRAMIQAEFNAIWANQAKLNPTLFNDAAKKELEHRLWHQRKLRPVLPGRCTLLPNEKRAPLALPSQQRFRILQEVNHLRILGAKFNEDALTLAERDALVHALEHHSKRSFTQIKKLLGVGGSTQFNIEDAKRQELKGNSTSAILADKKHFGPTWFTWSERQQDAIVRQLVSQQSEERLVTRLMKYCLVDEAHAEQISKASLPSGYGSLSAKALARILPELRRDVITYDKAIQAAHFEHHSNISHAASGEMLPNLPYYGENLQRHVGFGTGNPSDPPEKRFGKIANPTVHIGLNQARIVVNSLIKRYGHPSEIIVEVANELKRPVDHRKQEFRVGRITKDTMRRYCSCAGCINVRQAVNQELNKELRDIAFKVLGRPPQDYDMEKMRLWSEAKEISRSIVVCPYSGETLNIETILSSAVEIDHILPHSITLDNGLANKVLCIQVANRIKKERPPIEAKDDFMRLKGWDYENILARVKDWPEQKRYRFGADAMEKWKGRADTFLARSLNDTRYLSSVAREYMSLVCPGSTRVIPGQMTALLRDKFGLNGILGLKGIKNRNDHRHHAVDACVVAVTDQHMLQKFAQASASAREKQLDKLVETMPLPWDTYREHVSRAVNATWVSHKPDHGHEGELHEETAYRPPHHDSHNRWRTRGIGGEKPNDKAADHRGMVAVTDRTDSTRHARDQLGRPLPYKGYVGGNNYCLEVFRDSTGKWIAEVVTAFEAQQFVAAEAARLRRAGVAAEQALHNAVTMLRNRRQSMNGSPLVMRLTKGDCLRLEVGGVPHVVCVVKMRADRNLVTLAGIHEANLDERLKGKDERPLYMEDVSANVLFRHRARAITVSPVGDLRDPGFKE